MQSTNDCSNKVCELLLQAVVQRWDPLAYDGMKLGGSEQRWALYMYVREWHMHVTRHVITHDAMHSMYGILWSKCHIWILYHVQNQI